MTEPDPLNPYAPTSALVDREGRVLEDVRKITARKPASLRRTAIRWFFVCSLSAIPSFVFGMAVTEGQQVAAMILGIAIFATGYTLLDYRTAQQAWRQNRLIGRTLRIAYGTRVAISLLFPVGAQIDVFSGMLAVELTEHITGQGFTGGGSAWSLIGFLLVLMTTLIQGTLMNIVLAVYGALILGVQIVIRAIRN